MILVFRVVHLEQKCPNANFNFVVTQLSQLAALNIIAFVSTRIRRQNSESFQRKNPPKLKSSMTIPIETLMRVALRNGATIALLLGFILAAAYGGVSDERQDRRPLKSLEDVKHIIVIYQENWSFDSLYGQFPGADGYANGFDTLPQVDRFAAPPYSALIYQTPSPLTGSPVVPDPAIPFRAQFPSG